MELLRLLDLYIDWFDSFDIDEDDPEIDEVYEHSLLCSEMMDEWTDEEDEEDEVSVLCREMSQIAVTQNTQE